MQFIKKMIIVGIIGVALYVLLSYHFILIGNTLKPLKKSSLTLRYTLFNAKGRDNEAILSIDELREDGIGELLVETGRLSEGELARIIAELDGKGD